MNSQELLRLAKKIDCDYEPGIDIEVNDFLQDKENVSYFNVVYHNNLYNVNIILKEFDIIEVKKVFTCLLCFIEYDSSFYVREEYTDRIEYELLSSMKSNKGFLMKVVFSPEQAKVEKGKII